MEYLAVDTGRTAENRGGDVSGDAAGEGSEECCKYCSGIAGDVASSSLPTLDAASSGAFLFERPVIGHPS